MTLRHMRIFVAVCQCNSVTAAAKKLFLAQPAVSLAIRELESYYGIRLFDRISKRLYITEQGKQFLNYATHIVALFDDMEKEIKDWDSVGTLRVGSSITIGTNLLPGYVKIFKSQYPQMNLQVVINNSEEIEKSIIANEIDLALIEGVVHYPQTVYEELMDDRLIIICGKTHPLNNCKEVQLKDLPKYDFILREKGSGGRELFDSTMLVNHIEVKPVWESVSTQAIIKAVIAGHGISVLPYLLVKQYLKSNEISEVKLTDVSFNRKFYIIYHKNKYLTNSARDFISICKNYGNNLMI